MNYYLILGIDTDANKKEIKEAYRKMVQKYHPDHFGEDSSVFLRIQEAYHVLSDPARKRRYDQSISKPASQGYLKTSKLKDEYTGNPEPLIHEKKPIEYDPISLSRSFGTYSPSFDEIFDRLFFNSGSSQHQKSEKIENLKVDITINRRQAKSGGSIQLLIPARLPCPLCHGVGFMGIWECSKCASYGTIDTDIPLIVSYPAGMQNTFIKRIPLNRFGIDKFFITVYIRVSDEIDRKGGI
jgi:molecular chaperone DnaJ